MKRVMDNLSASKLPSIHEENSKTLEKVEKKIDELEGKFSKMNRTFNQSNQELVKLVSTMINLNFEEKLKDFKTEFATKEETDQSHQALLKLGDKMDTILATLQEATSTTNLWDWLENSDLGICWKNLKNYFNFASFQKIIFFALFFPFRKCISVYL